MTPVLPPLGLRHVRTIPVTPDLTVPGLPAVMGRFQDFPPVLATPYLICLVESACIEAVAPHLPDGHMTVGTHVDLHHLAATPVGRTVTAEVELVERQGNLLRFRAEVRDERGVVGRGTHDRMMVETAALIRRLERKT